MAHLPLVCQVFSSAVFSDHVQALLDMLQSLSDEGLWAEIKQSPFFPQISSGLFARHRLLFGNLLTEECLDKKWLHDEYKAMATARALGIRVPAVHRLVIDEENKFFILIMDLIDGSTVYGAWPNLGQTLAGGGPLRSHSR